MLSPFVAEAFLISELGREEEDEKIDSGRKAKTKTRLSVEYF